MTINSFEAFSLYKSNLYLPNANDLPYQKLRPCTRFTFNLNKQMHKNLESRTKKVRKKKHSQLSYSMTFSMHRIFTFCWKKNCLVNETHLGWFFFKLKHMIIKIMLEISHDTFLVRKRIVWLSTFNKIHLKLFKLA